MSRKLPWLEIAVGLSILIALVLRIAVPFHSVFTDNGIQLNTPDAYYMIRYADTYPNNIGHDYFLDYPNGIDLPREMLWPKIIGWVSATFTSTDFPITVMGAGAFLPPILFLLSLIPLYVITRRLFKSQLISSLSLIVYCLLPGDVLHRTSLGAADYHGWEILLLSLIIMCAVIAATSRRWYVLLFTALGCLALIYVYFISWAGWPLVLAILGLFAIITVMRKSDSIGRIMLTYMFLAIAMLLYAIFPNEGNQVIGTMRSMFTIEPNQIITEEYPLLFTAGQVDISAVWGLLGITFYIFLAGIGALIYRIFKYRNNGEILLLIWSIVILGITLARRRFDYYLGMNVAILTGYMIYLVIQQLRTNRLMISRVAVALGIVIVFPLLSSGILQASSTQGYMPKSWQETTQWLRQQTDSNNYITGGYPAYGMLTWRDYGYWVITEGHTPVADTPGVYRGLSAKILLMSDHTKALQESKELGFRYIAVDNDMVNGKAYETFRTAQDSKVIDSLTWDQLRSTLMYQLYYGQVDGAVPVFHSSDYMVRVVEVK